MNRPRTFTLLSLLALVLCMGGLVISWTTISGKSSDSQLLLAAVSFAYAAAAAATAIGLWRCQKWVVVALRIWVATFLTFIFAFIYSYSSMFTDSMLGIIGFLLFVAAISFLMDKQVRNKLAVST
jgi:hypothetical protein